MPSSRALALVDQDEPGSRDQDRAVRALMRLLAEMAEARAQVLRRRIAFNELLDRLRKELAPLEEQLL
ncbi:MAG TPA: hypothetical protein VK465_00165, partial [Fibrobacteria bacterium]|nr:hypothetical protein [Fibrobacteria bacterium]